MSESTSKISLIDLLSWGLAAFSLGFAIFALSRAWSNPLLDAHGFRQTQTALSVLTMQQGGPLLDYEVPVLGAPWKLPFEFPFYQWTTLMLSQSSSLSLEESGRLVSIFFFTWAVSAVWSLLKRLSFETRERLRILPLLLLSPHYLFWGRTFLIETTALALSLWYLSCGISALRKERWRMPFFLSLCCGTLGALVKLTTFSFYPLALLALREFVKRDPNENISNRSRTLALLILPMLPALAWSVHASSVRAEAPLAHFLENAQLGSWLFGNMAQRCSLATWNFLFLERGIPDLLGHSSVLVLFLFLGLLSRTYQVSVLFCLLLYFIYPAVFLPLFTAHEYYQSGSGVFFLGAVYSLLLGVAREKSESLSLFFSFALAAIAVNGYLQNFLPLTRLVDTSALLLAKSVEQATGENEKTLIYGLDWSPEIAFYSHRRVVMDRGFLPIESEEMKETMRKSLGGERFAAILACGRRVGSLQELETRVKALQFEPNRFSSVLGCRLYYREKDLTP